MGIDFGHVPPAGPAAGDESGPGDAPAGANGPAADHAGATAGPAARLFGIPAGERTSLVLRRVGVHSDDGGFMVDRRIRCRAEATGVIEDLAGTPRRLFVNLDPPIEGMDEIWLEDAALPGAHRRPAEDGAAPDPG